MVAIALWCAVASAADPPLRMGTVVPDGTSWARELKAFAREVEEGSHVKVKFYWGGITGDDAEAIRRIRRGQLDGAAGAATCSELAPSLKATRLQGIFPTRDDHERLVHQLPHLEEEFRKQGFVVLGIVSLGPSVLFSRTPVTSWDQIKRLRLWRWDIDPVAWQHDRLMGLTIVPTSVENASAAFDGGKVDGFVALAASALAFQWHSRAPYILPLEFDYLNACLVLSLSAWDALSIETQRTVRAAGAKLERRMELVGRESDRTVLQAFVGHTVRSTTVPAATREAFVKAAHDTRARAEGDGQVPGDAVQWILQHLGAPH